LWTGTGTQHLSRSNKLKLSNVASRGVSVKCYSALDCAMPKNLCFHKRMLGTNLGPVQYDPHALSEQLCQEETDFLALQGKGKHDYKLLPAIGLMLEGTN